MEILKLPIGNLQRIDPKNQHGSHFIPREEISFQGYEDLETGDWRS